MLRQKLLIPISILAAAWMIVGPDWMAGWGMASEKWMTFLTWLPAGIVFWMITSAQPGCYACEVRTFRRILGIDKRS